LAALIAANGGSSTPSSDGSLSVSGMVAATIGDLAEVHRIAIHELAPQEASLEDVYMKLTHDSVQYRSGASTEATPAVSTATPTPKAA
jgi:ABC-2 type transport system ATP-binding protein